MNLVNKKKWKKAADMCQNCNDIIETLIFYLFLTIFLVVVMQPSNKIFQEFLIILQYLVYLSKKIERDKPDRFALRNKCENSI